MGSDQSSDQTPKGTSGSGQDGDGDRGTATAPGTATARRSGGRRRSALVTAAVAAAVLLAGGGGVYLASGPGDGDKANTSADGAPEPLPLDGYAQGGGERSIAPGEPDPNGPGPVFTTTGPLPKGPERAKVHKAKGEVSRADVTALAKALDVAGTPRLRNGVWWVGGAKGPGLQVNRKAPGNWTFFTSGWTAGCKTPAKGTDPSAAECVSPDSPTTSSGAAGPAGERGGDPVSQAEAKRAAEPVFEAVGLGDAEPDAKVTVGVLRTVSAEPEVDGLPTLGWTTTVEVGPEGPVSGHGMLADLSAGEEYPVVSAEKALESLRGRPGPVARDIAPCVPYRPRGPKASAEPVLPADPERTKPKTGNGDGDRPRIAPCVPPRPVPQVVRKAEFGLSSQSVGGTSALVPSWLFTVAPKGSDDARMIAEVAVDPKYIAKSDKPEEPGAPGGPTTAKVHVESYTVKGRTLTVRFWGGVCHDYSAEADESGGRVKVEVTGKEKKPGQVCILIAKQFTEKVRLDKALGDRKVVDAATGESVPKK